MYYFKRLWLFCFLNFFYLSFSQDNLWERSYEGKHTEFLYDAHPIADYGFMLAGSSISDSNENKTDANNGGLDYSLPKINEKATPEWQKNIVSNTEQVSQSVNPSGVPGCSIWKKQATSKSISNVKDVKNNIRLNFNEAISISKDEQLLVSKSKLKSNFTLFVVFKSNEKQEKDILRYKVGREELIITNKQTQSTNGLEYSKYDAKSGVILEYSANLNGVKNANICSLFFGNQSDKNNDNSQNHEQKTAIFEFIFYPRILTETEKLKIESYLSIKYGVSLVGEKNYLSASNTKIWNFNDNKSFNKNVTGIAKDEKSDLFQKQFLNSSHNDIHIGFSSLDSISKFKRENLDNETFLVWGNNNENIVFQKDESDKENPIKKIKRVWKIQKNQVNDKNEINTFLIVNDSLFSSLEKKENGDTDIWLSVSSSSSDLFDYVNANYYRGEKTLEAKIIFKNIVWDKDKSGSDSFTFIKAPDLFMNYELIEQDCNLSQNGRVKIKVIGGVLPFVLNIQHNGVVTSLDKNSREFEIETPTSGDYHLTLIDSKKQSISQIVKTNLFDSFEGLLASEWFLNEEAEVEIVPNINSKNAKATYSYQWEKDNTVISNERTLKINQSGDYILNIKNDKGCEKEFPFKVLKKNSNTNDVIVYPNPVASNEEFKIKLDLENPSSVDIKIYTINGVLLKHDKMENIVNSEYFNKLQTSGSYLIVITTNNQSITSKLIVK